MKIHSFPLSILSAAVLTSSSFAQTDSPTSPEAPSAELEKASVTVPYAELRRLLHSSMMATLKEAVEKPKPPPMACGLMRAAYRLAFSENKFSLEGDFRVENFSGQWESIPLMNAGRAVASVEPGDARLIVQDEKLCLATQAIGATTVKLRFVEQDFLPETAGILTSLDLSPCAVCTIEISGLSEGRAASVKHGDESLAGSGKGVFALPSRGGLVQVGLHEAAKLAVEQAPPLPSEWTLQNEAAVIRGDGVLQHTVHSFLTALSGAGMNAVILLPGNARQAKVEGEGLAHWELERAPTGDQTLRLSWKDRGVLEREVAIRYSIPLAPLDTEWRMAAPGLAKDDHVKTQFVVAVPPVSVMEGPGVRQIVNGAGLSRWIAEALGRQTLATLEGARQATVTVKSLPQAATSEGIVKMAQYQTRIVADGSSITEAKFEVEHENGPIFTFSLPADASLLNCALDGQTLKPVKGPEGQLQIQLPGANDKTSRSVIATSFTAAKEKMDPVSGKTSAELPITPWFIHSLEWAMSLPEGYRISAVDGNVEYGAPSKAEHEVAVRKSLCRGEAAHMDIFYQKRGL